MAFDVFSFANILFERAFRTDALRRASADDRARVLRKRQGMELKPGLAELSREKFSIGRGHAADRVQTEMAQSCLGLRTDTPETRHRLGRKPGPRV